MKRSKQLDFVRAFSCVLILVYYISGYTNGYVNHGIFGWANIGVQIFFFLSGFLAATSGTYSNKWILKKYCKILIPYWIYLLIILPIIAVLDASKITAFKVILAGSGLMGFFWNSRIEPIGVLWFVSYILLCYSMTPIFNRLYNKMTNNKIGGGLCYIYIDNISYANYYDTICFFGSI